MDKESVTETTQETTIVSKANDKTQGYGALKAPTNGPKVKSLTASQVKAQVQPALDKRDRVFSRSPRAEPATQDWRKG